MSDDDLRRLREQLAEGVRAEKRAAYRIEVLALAAETFANMHNQFSTVPGSFTVEVDLAVRIVINALRRGGVDKLGVDIAAEVRGVLKAVRLGSHRWFLLMEEGGTKRVPPKAHRAARNIIERRAREVSTNLRLLHVALDAAWVRFNTPGPPPGPAPAKGLDVQPLTPSVRDSELAAMRERTKEAVASAFAVPAEMLRNDVGNTPAGWRTSNIAARPQICGKPSPRKGYNACHLAFGHHGAHEHVGTAESVAKGDASLIRDGVGTDESVAKGDASLIRDGVGTDESVITEAHKAWLRGRK